MNHVTIPWHRACLCVNCSTVSDAKLDVCPVCGDRGLLNLSKVLDREPLTASQQSRMEAA